MTTIKFDDVAAHNDIEAITDYGGLHWSSPVVADKAYVRHFISDPNGLESALHGTGVAATGDGSSSTDTFIAREESLFGVKSGIFAAAFAEEQTVVFRAYLELDIVATKIVTLGLEAETIEFGRKFKHISSFEITTEEADGGSGGAVAFDNLSVQFDDPFRSDEHLTAQPHAKDTWHAPEQVPMMDALYNVWHPSDTFGGMLC